MGCYKTLYHLCIRFFWPKLCTFVETFVAQCPHCVLINSHCCTASKLMHSWPLDAPFLIVHIDLWSPGDILDSDGNLYLMNLMCNMTQFIIITPCTDIHVHHLAHVFMQEVLLKVGFCAMVVMDNGNNFKELFRFMCETLNIHFHCLYLRAIIKLLALNAFTDTSTRPS